ncbi:hypothetical protein LSH36_233g05049 [Paralvinella palmiformis]|uniref:NADAR domain-containing protein n=1 Tax=Paralvinella palmiformis TaxID=53620 RepID=A0AAD9JNI8_9ANNE|nr:hypothetical protein LSH36_233g05049 [Paralvinella palmiformis]
MLRQYISVILRFEKIARLSANIGTTSFQKNAKRSCEEAEIPPSKRQRRWKVPPPEDFRGFAGKNDVLSNFYPCRLYVYGMMFGSTEHAYQWRKARIMGNIKVAYRIYHAEHAGKAKQIANQYFRGTDLSTWIPQRIPVMKQLLRAKARCCKPFRDELRNTGDRLIAEIVPGEKYWGLDDGTGENVMGKLLMELRSNLDDALKADPYEDGKLIDMPFPIIHQSPSTRKKHNKKK